jgi:hypothetical protein
MRTQPQPALDPLLAAFSAQMGIGQQVRARACIIGCT